MNILSPFGSLTYHNNVLENWNVLKWIFLLNLVSKVS